MDKDFFAEDMKKYARASTQMARLRFDSGEKCILSKIQGLIYPLLLSHPCLLISSLTVIMPKIRLKGIWETIETDKGHDTPCY